MESGSILGYRFRTCPAMTQETRYAILKGHTLGLFFGSYEIVLNPSHDQKLDEKDRTLKNRVYKRDLRSPLGGSGC